MFALGGSTEFGRARCASDFRLGGVTKLSAVAQRRKRGHQALREKQPVFSAVTTSRSPSPSMSCHDHLQAAPRAATVVHDVPDPFDGAFRAGPELVPVDSHRLPLVGSCPAPEVRLADEIHLAVAVDIRQRGRVGVGPRRVDDTALPRPSGKRSNTPPRNCAHRRQTSLRPSLLTRDIHAGVFRRAEQGALDPQSWMRRATAGEQIRKSASPFRGTSIPLPRARLPALPAIRSA